MIVYFLICIIALLLAHISSKINRFTLLFVAIILLTIVSGFRDYSVGTDTHTYHYVFNHYTSNMEYTYGQERGFLEISRIVVSIFRNDRAMFVTCSFITNFMIIAFLWKLRNQYSLTLMFFFYITLFYPDTMNIMRQYLGASIVFYYTYLLKKRKYIIHILIITICGIIFHRSIFIAVSITILWYVLYDRSDYRKIKVFVLTLLSLPFILNPIINTFDEYSWYFVDGSLSLGIMIILNICVYLIYCCIYSTRVKNKLDFNEICIDKFLIYTYGISLLFNLIGCYYDQMGRIGLCFSLFKIPLYARMCSNNKYRQFFIVVNVILALYYIIVRVVINGECGVFPYSMNI